MFQAARWGGEWDMRIRLVDCIVVFYLQGMPVELEATYLGAPEKARSSRLSTDLPPASSPYS